MYKIVVIWLRREFRGCLWGNSCANYRVEEFVSGGGWVVGRVDRRSRFSWWEV